MHWRRSSRSRVQHFVELDQKWQSPRKWKWPARSAAGAWKGRWLKKLLQVMKTGRIAILDYGIADETAWSVGLACGGKIKILIQPIEEAGMKGLTGKIIQKLIELKSTGKSFCLLTDLSDEGNGDIVILSEGKVVFPEKKPFMG